MREEGENVPVNHGEIGFEINHDDQYVTKKSTNNLTRIETKDFNPANNPSEFAFSKSPELNSPSIPVKRKGGKTQILYNERMYNAYKQRMDSIKEEEKLYEINEIKYFMKTKKIHCFKYNYAFEEVVQNFNSYLSYIQLSPDG